MIRISTLVIKIGEVGKFLMTLAGVSPKCSRCGVRERTELRGSGCRWHVHPERV